MTIAAFAPFEFELRWIAWRNELRNGQMTKVPYSPHGGPAKADDPSTWDTRSAAEARAKKLVNGQGGGIGIELGDLGDGTSLGGVDLDTCLAGDLFESWAVETVRRLGSYAEISPSGTGAKIFFRYRTDDLSQLRANMGGPQHGKMFKRTSGGDHPPAIELHLSNRYFATTEQWLSWTPDRVVEIPTETLIWLLTEHGPEFVRTDPASETNADGSEPRAGANFKTNGGDKSRSGAAFRLACKMRREGRSYEDFVEALRTDPETASWYEEKGKAKSGREAKRAWNRADPEANGYNERPIVKIWGGGLPTYVDQAERILIESDTELFQRGDFIVRPAREMIGIADQRETPGWRLLRVTTPYLVEHMTRLIDFQRFDARSGDWVSLNCAVEIAATYLSRVGHWKIRPIAGIISAPTLRPDGSILELPGYDPATQLLYVPALDYSAIPQEPTQAQARAALDTLAALIDKFPFVDSNGDDATGKPSPSRSVAFSASLTAMIRRSIPRAPLHAFTAPVMGSGKSKLVDIASMIATGHEAPVITQGKDETEMEKRLGAMLLSSDTLISFDNCEQPLGGELLSQALTQSTIKVRILGKSETPTVPSCAMFAATGNNLIVAGDMTRRTIMATLDPRVERPELRQFDSDPIDHIRGDRDLYVSAALVVLRAYVVAGKPVQATPLGSFEGWSRLVRDALLWLGEDDPCVTIERARAEDPHTQALGEVLAQWWEAVGEAGVVVKRVIEIAEQKHQAAERRAPNDFSGPIFPEPVFKHPELRDALLEVAGDRGVISNMRLGKWLAKNKGRVVGGLRIDPGPGAAAGGVVRWKLSRAPEG